jgi:hypothetical protein
MMEPRRPTNLWASGCYKNGFTFYVEETGGITKVWLIEEDLEGSDWSLVEGLSHSLSEGTEEYHQSGYLVF